MKMKKCLTLCSLILVGSLFLFGCGKEPVATDINLPLQIAAPDATNIIGLHVRNCTTSY